MTKKRWCAQAPANIALIKYMGKFADNIPCNSSLSFSSAKFYSEVSLHLCEADTDSYAVWDGGGGIVLQEIELNRFLNHLRYIKSYYDFNGCFKVSSRNSFPSSCGLASSASSFAALSKAASVAIAELQQRPHPSCEEVSRLSRFGSGSACRSIYSPWSLWQGDHAKPLHLPYGDIQHFVIVLNGGKKMVSSSAAHARVRSSMLFTGRAERANARLSNLLIAMRANNWADIYQLVLAEFWDMHALFFTSQPSFNFILPETLAVLQQVSCYWEKHNDGPLVTLDAGANVHLLFRAEQKSAVEHFFQLYNGIILG